VLLCYRCFKTKRNLIKFSANYVRSCALIVLLCCVLFRNVLLDFLSLAHTVCKRYLEGNCLAEYVTLRKFIEVKLECVAVYRVRDYL